MSSIRNAVQRRSHKERAQPLERQKWGLLEKGKDYKLRAADHRHKRAKLKILTQKARDRNPDEFSFKMMSSRVDKEGKRMADRGNKALSVDVVKLLKTQDAGYIRTMLQITRKEIEELEQKLTLEGKGDLRMVEDTTRRARRRVFVDDEDEQEEFTEESWFGKGESLPETKAYEHSRHTQDESGSEESQGYTSKPKQPSKKTIKAQQLAEQEARNFERDRRRAHSKTANKLVLMKKREEELATAEDELDAQRARMSNTVYSGVNKQGKKFKIRERKK